MKKYLFTLVLFSSIMCFTASNYKTASQTLYLQNFIAPTVSSLLATPQVLTGSWANLGGEQDTSGKSSIGLFVVLDIQSSGDARVRALAKHTSGGDNFVLPIKTVGSGSVAVEAEYIEFTNDADQKMLLSWDLDRIIPYIQFQVSVGSVGSTGGNLEAEIDDAFITKGWR